MARQNRCLFARGIARARNRRLCGPRPPAVGETSDIDDGHGAEVKAAGAVGPELCQGESSWMREWMRVRMAIGTSLWPNKLPIHTLPSGAEDEGEGIPPPPAYRFKGKEVHMALVCVKLLVAGFLQSKAVNAYFRLVGRM